MPRLLVFLPVSPFIPRVVWILYNTRYQNVKGFSLFFFLLYLAAPGMNDVARLRSGTSLSHLLPLPYDTRKEECAVSDTLPPLLSLRVGNYFHFARKRSTVSRSSRLRKPTQTMLRVGGNRTEAIQGSQTLKRKRRKSSLRLRTNTPQLVACVCMLHAEATPADPLLRVTKGSGCKGERR